MKLQKPAQMQILDAKRAQQKGATEPTFCHINIFL